MLIGEIYLMNFDGSACEQQGWRPGLVFQNNVGNEFSPNIIALPFTTSIKKIGQPTHVFIPNEVGLIRDSVILCENPQRMSKDRIGKFLLKLPDSYMSLVAEANMLASSAISYVDPDTLLSIWQKAISLNCSR